MNFDKLIDLKQVEAEAKLNISTIPLHYYESGANGMVTLQANETAYAHFKLKTCAEVHPNPRTDTVLFGQKLDSPICIAQTAFHRMAHPLGELDTARAAVSHNTAMGLSCYATTSLEDVAEVNPGGVKML